MRKPEKKKKKKTYAFSKDWMAFEELHRPLFREHGSIYFANGNKPSKELNYAFCEVWLPLYKLFSILYTHFYTRHALTFSHVHSLSDLIAQLIT